MKPAKPRYVIVVENSSVMNVQVGHLGQARLVGREHRVDGVDRAGGTGGTAGSGVVGGDFLARLGREGRF